MDQPFYQSNLVLNSVETSPFADYLLSPNEANMDFMGLTPQGTDVLGIWNSRDSNTSAFVVNQENHDDTQRAHGRNTALSLNSGSNPIMELEERRCERINITSSENVDLNLNNTPVDDGQALHPSHMNQSAEAPHGDIMEVSLCTSVPDLCEPESVSYSNSNGSSSSGVGKGLEYYDRTRNSVEIRRTAFKRKKMEGVIGESSSGHSIAGDLSIASSSRYLPAECSSGETERRSFGSMHGGDSSEFYISSSLSENAETSQRNLPAQLKVECWHDVSSSQSHSTMSCNSLATIWSPGEPSSVPNPSIHLEEQSQPHMLPPPGFLPHQVHHSISSSRIGSSSIPAIIQRRMRLIASHEEENIRRLPSNGIDNHSTFLARTSVNQLVQDPPNWNPSSSNLSISENRVSTNSGIIPLPGSIREQSEMVTVQYPANLVEAVSSSLSPSGGSESGHQSTTLSSQHPGCSASTQEPGHQSSRAIRQGHPLLYPRPAVSTDRQRGFSALSLTARSRDGRSRMISEIRNALDLIRSGANLRFEDVFNFEPPEFYGRADLNDRHRDMRLDVDNMSYEELLALEERIGYVSTGLGEQTILKLLKQRKYSPCKLEVASSFSEQEPCCICREDYNEGEDVGTLNCRHDFHTACIKQWLMIKNLCPICKTTALVEGHSTISDGTK